MSITQQRLKQLLGYDPETGQFVWLVSRGGKAPAGKMAGAVDDLGYLKIGIDGREYKAHRLAWLYVYGEFPDGDLDHKDRDKRNNRIANLRIATDSQNLQNTAMYSNNKSGYRGVSWNKRKQRWEARIASNCKLTHLGYYEDPRAAYGAYLKAAAMLHTMNPLVGEASNGQ